MDIVGALSKSHTNSIVYFCEYNEAEWEKEKIAEISENLNNISLVIIDSTDEMTEDVRIVGVVDSNYAGIYLSGYEDLDVYVKQLCGKDNVYDTATA